MTSQRAIALLSNGSYGVMIWSIMGRCQAVVAGLRRAGFRRGWL